MFPDMMAPAPGYYLGVVLSSELPVADRELFQDLLAQMTDFRVQVRWSVRFNRKHASNIPPNTVNQCNKVLFLDNRLVPVGPRDSCFSHLSV